MDIQLLDQVPIPSLKGFYISHIDNFGNIKTTIKESDLKGKFEYGEKLKIKINNVTHLVTYAQGLFKYKPNELIIYPGSSGKKDDPYLEISVWRYFTDKKNMATGVYYFKNPLPGETIEILD
jgi:S-adenosylmethionine hydrolase